MSLPIVEQIAENIKASIAAITKVNGFNQNLKAVRPRKVDFDHEFAPVDCMVLIVQTDEVAVENPAHTTKEWVQTFVLEAFVGASDKERTSIDTRINMVRADIRKKLMADPQRGKLAINTVMQSSLIFTDTGRNIACVDIEVDVHYRTVDGDPYTKA